jgi:hypothetical protein
MAAVCFLIFTASAKAEQAVEQWLCFFLQFLAQNAAKSTKAIFKPLSGIEVHYSNQYP